MLRWLEILFSLKDSSEITSSVVVLSIRLTSFPLERKWRKMKIKRRPEKYTNVFCLLLDVDFL